MLVFVFLQITKKMKNKNKNTFSRQWGYILVSLPGKSTFSIFSLFLICRDHTRCTAKSIRSREDKKKNFPSLFLIRRDRARCTAKSIRSQGREQSETTNDLIIILIKYEKDLKKIKQIRHCNIIPLDLPKWVFLEQMEMVFGEMKFFSKWKQCSGCNGIAPIGQKCIENIKPETLSKFQQHRFQILIKTESDSS